MKPKRVVLSFAVLALFAGNLVAEPLGTAFTYQGKLADSGNPANGSYDLTFILYDAVTNDTQWGSPVDIKDCVVSNGADRIHFSGPFHVLVASLQ